MRVLSIPKAPSASRWPMLLVGLAIAVWLCLCALLVVGDMSEPTKRGVAVLAAFTLIPILLLSISRLPVYLLAAYAASVPFGNLLTIQEGMTNGAGGGSVTYLKLLGIATAVAFIISMIVSRRAVRPSRSMLVLGALIAYTGATILWAIDPLSAIQKYALYLNPVLLFVVIALYRLEPRDLKVIVQATIWGAVLAAGYGAYTFSHSMNDVQQARLYLSFSNDFVYDESIDPNDFAASLMLPFALTLMMFLRARLGAAKICWLAALAVVCAGFVVTGSRGAAFGAAIMIAYLIWRSRHRVQLLILAAISVIPLMATPLIHRFSDATLATGSGRIGIWKVGIASLHRYWLFGAGFGNFNNAYRQYFLSVPHPDELLWNRIAHSIFIGSAVELGLVGLVLMIAFWFLQFRELARVKSSGFIGDISVALSSAVLGLFVTGSTLSLMGSKYTWLTFSLIALTRSIVMQSPRSYERT